MIQKIKTKLIKFVLEDSAGSAIILALIIIAGLAGTGLGAARLTQQNTQLNTEYEDSLKAYYAAEAGIEAALLEWRYNHDVEFWDADKASGCVDSPSTCTDDLKLPKCVTLDSSTILSPKADNQLVSTVDCKTAGTIKGKPWYELRISYRDPKNPYLGNYPNSSATSMMNEISSNYPTLESLPSVKKDETRQISFPKSDNIKELYIYWAADGLGFVESEYMRLLVHTVAEDGSGNQCMVGNGVADCGSGLIGKSNQGFYTRIVGADQNAIIGQVYNPAIPSNSGLQAITDVRIKCLSASANVESKAYVAVAAYTDNLKLVHIPLDYTTIESIGHYNGVERKVVYTIDRQSGTIQNVYDFGVMSKETLRK